MYRNYITPIAIVTQASQVPSSESGIAKIAAVTALSYLRKVDPSISEAIYHGIRFHREPMGGAFVDERARVDTGVFAGPKVILYGNVSAFYNPDSATFTPETVLVGNTLLRGNVKVYWWSYISNANISGNIELKDIKVCGGKPKIAITGEGKIIGGQNKSKGDVHISPTITLNNVSFIGKINITGTGVISHLTKFALDRLVLENATAR